MDDMNKDDMYIALSELALESWRLRQYTAGLLGRMIDGQVKKRGNSQLHRFDRRGKEALDRLGLELLDFTGESFDTGLPVYPINLNDFEGDIPLIIEMTLEPTIKVKDSADILHKGTVVVGGRSNEVLCGD